MATHMHANKAVVWLMGCFRETGISANLLGFILGKATRWFTVTCEISF